SPRKPSHFGSNCQPAPSGSSRTSSASIGGNGIPGSRSPGRSGGSWAARLPRATSPTYYAPLSMRRVVITGLGAITPIGNDLPSPWDAAVAGRSGVDVIQAFDAGEFPVRIAAEVKGFDPTSVAPPKEARRMERCVLLALGAAQEAWADAGVDSHYPSDRVGVVFGSAIGGLIWVADPAGGLRSRRPHPL